MTDRYILAWGEDEEATRSLFEDTSVGCEQPSDVVGWAAWLFEGACERCRRQVLDTVTVALSEGTEGVACLPRCDCPQEARCVVLLQIEDDARGASLEATERDWARAANAVTGEETWTG